MHVGDDDVLAGYRRPGGEHPRELGPDRGRALPQHVLERAPDVVLRRRAVVPGQQLVDAQVTAGGVEHGDADRRLAVHRREHGGVDRGERGLPVRHLDLDRPGRLRLTSQGGEEHLCHAFGHPHHLSTGPT